MDRVWLVMLDTAGADIDHAVLYRQSNGELQALVGTYEAAPFGPTYFEFAGWLHNIIRSAIAQG